MFSNKEIIHFLKPQKKYHKTFIKIICIASLYFICCNSIAQNVNLNEAYAIAIQNSKMLKNEKLKTEFAKAFVNASREIPKANVFTELGQMNSALFDTKFGIAQTLPFPTIYKKQKQVYESDFNITKANVVLKEFELKKTVADLYYQFQFLKEKENLLVSTDSLFSNFYTKSALRLQKGESNVLEKTTAENQKNTIALQLLQLQQEINSLLIYFRYVLNVKDAVPLFEKNFPLAIIDTIAIANHPTLAIYNQEINLAMASTALEQAKLKPDFNVGIYNSSFRGLSPNNIVYRGLDRFTAVQLGLAIPIFAKSQKAKIRAFAIKEKIAESNVQIVQEKLVAEFEKCISNYKSNVEILDLYKLNALKNAALIKQVASKQFVNGEINYLDFVMLIHQAINIENNFIDARHALNKSIVQLNFITFQN
jgi:heavy metal efflux system protein